MKWVKGTYHYEKCIICNRRVRVPDDEDSFKGRVNYRYDAYVLKIGPATALQMGLICGRCAEKPVSERIITKQESVSHEP
jgi:hypothetical protein